MGFLEGVSPCPPGELWQADPSYLGKDRDNEMLSAPYGFTHSSTASRSESVKGSPGEDSDPQAESKGEL